jgi:hypothetical protein
MPDNATPWRLVTEGQCTRTIWAQPDKAKTDLRKIYLDVEKPCPNPAFVASESGAMFCRFHMPREAKTCAACVHRGSYNSSQAECRKNAPTGGGSMRTVPLVYPDKDWCAEFDAVGDGHKRAR